MTRHTSILSATITWPSFTKLLLQVNYNMNTDDDWDPYEEEYEVDEELKAALKYTKRAWKA